jgi:nucleotide-binding universal stress UspA family protein
MKILLAVDGSTFSDAAVEEIARKPWPPLTEVKVISVVEPPLLPIFETWVPPDSYFEELESAAKSQARAAVDKAAARLHEQQGDGLVISTEIIAGHPKYTITDEADDWGADLIVVGSHGYRGLTRLWLGSVSQTVASHAKCSVEIVRSRKKDKVSRAQRAV